MQIGYAQQTITPALDRRVYLAGFGQNRIAKTVHDDLSVRALLLKDEQVTIVLTALDLVGFFRPDVLEVIARVQEEAPSTQVIVASTHTHHGPDTMGLWGPDMNHSGVDGEYLTGLKDQIVDTILTAMAKPQPAAMKTSTIHVSGLAKNARDPEILDNELIVAQFYNPKNNTMLANLFIFPCHPEVMWEENLHITCDYPGYLRHEVEMASGAACIFFSGALGGMMTPDVQAHSFEEAKAMGKVLARSGLKALEETSCYPASAIRFQKQEFSVKLTNYLFKIAFRRGLLPDVRNRKGEITSEVNLIKIGPLWLATVPGELLPKLGTAIKTKLREAGAHVAGVISLANDELGYILPREDFHYPFNPFKPGKHYEETMSLGKDIGPKVVEAIQGLL